MQGKAEGGTLSEEGGRALVSDEDGPRAVGVALRRLLFLRRLREREPRKLCEEEEKECDKEQGEYECHEGQLGEAACSRDPRRRPVLSFDLVAPLSFSQRPLPTAKATAGEGMHKRRALDVLAHI